MRAKKDYAIVVAERVQDLKTLIEYFSVTRVMHCPEYEDRCVPGQFSWDRFHSARIFYVQYRKKQITRNWPTKVRFRQLQQAWNDTLGIPKPLMDLVVGVFRGKRIPRKILYSQILDWKYTKGANKMWRGRQHVFEGYFTATNDVYWKSLLHNPAYSTYQTIPNISDRMKKILEKWEQQSR